MKFRLSERGIVLAEFAIALPLLILLLGALGIVTLNALKIAREQVADYALETEAQYVMYRVTSDARAAHRVEITSFDSGRDEIYLIYHAVSPNIIGVKFYDGENFIDSVESHIDILDRRFYLIGNNFSINAKRHDDNILTNPITGGNSYGSTIVTQFKFDEDKLSGKILHVTLELQNSVTNQKVRLCTSVYMPACKKIICHGKTILDEE